MKKSRGNYHRFYKIYEKEIRLNADATSVLNVLHARKIDQYILSAAAKDDLINVNTLDLQNKFIGYIWSDGYLCEWKNSDRKVLNANLFAKP